MISKSVSDFGTTSFGQIVHKINLSNSNGMQVSFLTYGATIKEILVPTCNKLVNVVLGYKSIEGYEKGSSFIGAFVGRYANRIGNSCFDLEGQHINIPANEGKNHLHGCFSKKIFNYSFENNCVVFSYLSPDGEEGFPGNLNVNVAYSLSEDNRLQIEYSAKTDKTTVVNFTNHSYFNLNGNKSSVLNHLLSVDASYFTATDRFSIPTGELVDVSGTPMDFRKEKLLGSEINADYLPLVWANGYDHNYVVNPDKKIKKIATLKGNSIKMDCYSDQVGVQVYTANYLNTDKGDSFLKHQAVCLETQHFADSPNKANFPSTVLKPEEEFRSTTIYCFTINP